LLVNVSVPLTAPVADGVKITVYGTLFPAGIVTGNDNPLIVNAALFELAALTVTLAPAAVRLPEPVLLVPTTTLPMASVAGDAVRVPAAAVPVPDNGIARDGFVAFEVTVTVPLKLVAEVGVNITLNVVLDPDVNVTGVVIPLRLNPFPVIEA
jgi:hypothetical protein